MIKNSELFNLDGSIFQELFNKYQYPYEILPIISEYIQELSSQLSKDYNKLKENVWVHKTAQIGNGVEIIGPAIIMENTQIRHNAYLRENVIIGPNSVIGNSCEIKNSIIIAHAEIPHFNYVGDSIIGTKTHLGAGVIISNLRLDKKNIRINHQDTNLRKIGAFIGDNVQVGCNSVLCPGTIVYPNTIIYPLMTIKGIVDNKSSNVHVERL